MSNVNISYTFEGNTLTQSKGQSSSQTGAIINTTVNGGRTSLRDYESQTRKEVDHSCPQGYVKTPAFEAVLQGLRETGGCLVLGLPGHGKTTLALQAMKHLRDTEGCHLVRMTEASEWKKLLGMTATDGECSSEKHIIFVDDFLGKSNYREDKYLAWEDHFDGILPRMRSGEFYVIMVCRSHVYNACSAKLENTELFSTVRHIQLQETSYWGNGIEEKILENFMPKLTDDIANVIPDFVAASKKAPIAFPLAAQLFASNPKAQVLGKGFFKKPQHFLRKQLHVIKKENKISYCVLVLTWLNDGHLSETFLQDYSENSSKHLNHVGKMCGLEKPPNIGQVRESAESLCGVYFEKDPSGDGYRFCHNCVSDALVVPVCEADLKGALQVCSMQQVNEYVITKGCKMNQDEIVYTVFKPQWKILADKIIHGIASGNKAAYLHPSLKDFYFFKKEIVPRLTPELSQQIMMDRSKSIIWEVDVCSNHTTLLSILVEHESCLIVDYILGSQEMKFLSEIDRSLLLEEAMTAACHVHNEHLVTKLLGMNVPISSQAIQLMCASNMKENEKLFVKVYSFFVHQNETLDMKQFLHDCLDTCCRTNKAGYLTILINSCDRKMLGLPTMQHLNTSCTCKSWECLRVFMSQEETKQDFLDLVEDLACPDTTRPSKSLGTRYSPAMQSEPSRSPQPMMGDQSHEVRGPRPRHGRPSDPLHERSPQKSRNLRRERVYLARLQTLLEVVSKWMKDQRAVQELCMKLLQKGVTKKVRTVIDAYLLKSSQGKDNTSSREPFGGDAVLLPSELAESSTDKYESEDSTNDHVPESFREGYGPELHRDVLISASNTGVHRSMSYREWHGPGTYREGHGPESYREGHGPETHTEEQRPEFYREEHGLGTYEKEHGPETYREEHRQKTYREELGPETPREGHGPETYREEHGPETCTEEYGPDTYREGHGPEIYSEKHGPGTYREEHGSGTYREGHGPRTYREGHGPGIYREKHGSGTYRERHRPGTYRERHGPGTYRERHGPEIFRVEHGSETYREEHGSETYREEHGPGTYRERQGPETYREEYGLGTYKEEHGPGTYGERHRPGTYREGHGPGTYREGHGPGTYREEHEPETCRVEVGPGTYREGHGPGTYREEHGPGTYREGQGPEIYREEHGPETYREHGPGTYRKGHRQETYRERHGPGTYRERQGPGTYRERHGPGTYREEHGPRTYREGHGPETYREGHGPGTYREVHGPGTYRERHGPETYREGHGPGTYREGHGSGTYREEHGPGTYREEYGPGTYREGHGPGTYREGHGPGTYRERHGPGTYREGHGPGTYREGHGPGTYREEYEPETYRVEVRPGTYREGHGPETYREEHGPETHREGHGPGTYRERHGSRTYREGHRPGTYRERHGPESSGERHETPSFVENYIAVIRRFLLEYQRQEQLECDEESSPNTLSHCTQSAEPLPHCTQSAEPLPDSTLPESLLCCRCIFRRRYSNRNHMNLNSC